MLYCPRCNNTHWIPVVPEATGDYLLILALRRRYRCLKCDKVLSGSIFNDFHWPSLAPRKHRSSRKKEETPDPKCVKCGHPTHRSRRRGIERIIPFWRAYRCEECKHRFKVFHLA